MMRNSSGKIAATSMILLSDSDRSSLNTLENRRSTPLVSPVRQGFSNGSKTAESQIRLVRTNEGVECLYVVEHLRANDAGRSFEGNLMCCGQIQ